MKTKKNESFQKNFEILKKSVNLLEKNEDVQVDELIPIVDQARTAYEACKERLDLIEQSLQEKLNKDENNSSTNT